MDDVTENSSRLHIKRPYANSFAHFEELVNRRLESSWGRPVRKLNPGMQGSALHELIDQIPGTAAMDEVGRHRLHQQWNQVQLRCVAHPFEAAIMDRRGRTCLHAVCVKRPPGAVVNAIIDACARHGESILERDKHGRTPLAIAISSNADLHVIEILLKKCGRSAAVADHAGMLPLHLACSGYDGDKQKLVQLLLEAYPEGASKESNDGKTALHTVIEGNGCVDLIKALVAISPESVVMARCGLNPLFIALRRNCHPKVIEILMQGNPEAGYSRDATGAFPLRRAVEARLSMEIVELLAISPRVVLDTDRSMGKTALHNALDCGVIREPMVRLLVTIAPEIAVLPSKAGQTPLQIICLRFLQSRSRRQDHALWNSLLILSRAAKYHRINENDPILHAVVSLNLPWEVTELTMQHFPNQLRERTQDGYIPLVLSIQSAPNKTKATMILSFLRQYEDAALFRTPDGRSLLSLAAYSKGIPPIIFRELINRQPESLYEVDPILGLYVFQVAALRKDPTNNHGIGNSILCEDPEDPDPWLQLSAIYELLLAAPDVIQSGIFVAND